MKVLVVDDEQDVALLFQQRFRKEIRSGYVKFEFAFSGEEAMQYIGDVKSTDLILILSDINMPGMSGLDLLTNIRNTRPDLKVFMITAYGDAEKREQALELGATDFLTKPIDFQALKERIRAVVPANE